MYLKLNSFFVYGLMFFCMSLIFLFFGVLAYAYMYTYFLEWILMSINSYRIGIVFLFDYYSLFFMGVVCLISGSICLYSSSYMMNESRKFYFLLVIIVFVLSMLMVICSPNLISIILGWDGLGLSSYLLVIYYQNNKSYNAGMLTILTNRLGDVMILISIGWMFSYSSMNYFIYLYYYMANYDYNNFMLMMIILAGMTKSAQIPFSAWLPAAMAAPTPVSSLVHSSTLVTAGVYLLIRFSGIFEVWFSEFLLFISGCTMLMSGVGAFLEYDFKKIIALSTLSQLGLMMGALSLGLVNYCFFHLLSHALFKALLFMCAGYMIHCMGGSQDIRMYGGMFHNFPLIMISFNVSNLSLCGFPFLTGFYSKDLILELLMMKEMNVLSMFFFFFSTLFTVMYSLRLMMFLLGSENNFFSYNFVAFDKLMAASIHLLLIGSIFGGSILMWLLFPFVHPVIIPLSMKLILSMNLLLGMFLSILFFFMKSFNLGMMSYFLSLMWNLPKISTDMLIFPSMFVMKFYLKYVDQGLIEYLIGKKMGDFLMNMSHSMSMELTGKNFKVYLFFFIYLYLMVMMLMIM